MGLHFPRFLCVTGVRAFLLLSSTVDAWLPKGTRSHSDITIMASFGGRRFHTEKDSYNLAQRTGYQGSTRSSQTKSLGRQDSGPNEIGRRSAVKTVCVLAYTFHSPQPCCPFQPPSRPVAPQNPATMNRIDDPVYSLSPQLFYMTLHVIHHLPDPQSCADTS